MIPWMSWRSWRQSAGLRGVSIVVVLDTELPTAPNLHRTQRTPPDRIRTILAKEDLAEKYSCTYLNLLSSPCKGMEMGLLYCASGKDKSSSIVLYSCLFC